jgi:hypothetical protein
MRQNLDFVLVLLTMAMLGAPEMTAQSAPAPQAGANEGCQLNPYTGAIPLEKLPYHFEGEEDLRGGMTCRFRIHASLPVFIFHFPGQPDNTFGDLEITDEATGKEIQTIQNSTDPSAVAPASVKNLVTLVDANFDGYRDLQILLQCGATGNCSYNFYVYDPKTQEFVYNTFLSGLVTPSFDTVKKQVMTSSNSSASDTQSETYQYKDGQYTLIWKEVSEWNRQKKTVTVSTYELRNGKMELVHSDTSPE